VYTTGKDANSEINPSDQIAILRRLSSFVEKKQSPVTIIFPGRPSKKIPDGAKQDGVQARFSTSDQLEKVVRQCIAEFQNDHSVILAADRSEFQKLAAKLKIGYSLVSTFTKTLETTCGPIQRETKPQTPRRQPATQKSAQQPNDSSPVSENTEVAPRANGQESPTNPASEPLEQAHGNEASPISEATSSQDPAAPKPAQSSRPKLHRHVPSQKKEYTDRAILDLIDPL
jgi:hypothetical protein